jgi:hypothetical protein
MNSLPLKLLYSRKELNIIVFALECEFVQKDKVLFLAIVSIVGFNGNIVDEGKVYPKPGIFVVVK